MKKNFQQKTTQNSYEFRSIPFTIRSPDAAKKGQHQEQKRRTVTPRPALSAVLSCCKIRKSVNTFSNLAREFTPLDPRRKDNGPEESVHYLCSGELAYE